MIIKSLILICASNSGRVIFILLQQFDYFFKVLQRNVILFIFYMYVDEVKVIKCPGDKS